MQATAASSRRPAPLARVCRVVGGALAGLAGIVAAGCSSVSADTRLMTFAASAPRPTLVARGSELTAAQSAAREQPGCFAVRGEGCSMEPVYLSGTAVVVRAGGFEHLHVGQPVVYASRRGMAVAHMLVRQTDSGWIAAGLNNDLADGELVTRDNLVGVITQAFASKAGPLPEAAAARFALGEQVKRSDRVASLGL